jgi:uracil phosphoribosyltransferase
MLTVLNHPVIKNKIAILRDKNTKDREFREIVEEISTILAYEATKNITTIQTVINTPMEQTTAEVINSKFGVVPILRAGTAMLNGVLNFLPFAKVGHIGMYRDRETFMPIKYYCKFPEGNRIILLVDPMLATGGTASASIQLLKDFGFTQIKLLCIISCPEGVAKLEKEHPDVEIFSAAHDRELDSNNYILPGLGDAGDRIFGTI